MSGNLFNDLRITDTDDTDDIALLANTPTQTKSLLPSLEHAAGRIDPHVNVDKTEYRCFNNKKEDISILNGDSPKLGDKFTYPRNSVLSTGSDINMRLEKD